MDELLEALPEIQNSLGAHQIYSIKRACQIMGISKIDLEMAEELTGVYSLLKKKRHNDFKALMYQMLVRVGCRSETFNQLKLTTDEVELEFEVDVILSIASMIDRMEDDLFSMFRNFAWDTFLSGYHIDNVSSKVNLLKHLFEKVRKQEKVLATIAGQCPEYRQEFDDLCSRHGRTIDIPVQSMVNVVVADGPGRRKERNQRCCIWTCIVGLPLITTGFFLVSAIVIFTYFYLNPVSSGVTTHYSVYAPNLTVVTALIDCFSLQTKGITVSKTSNDFNVSLFKVQQDRLKVHPVPLAENVLLQPRFELYDHSVLPINYFKDDNPIYTATDGNVTFDIYIKAAIDNSCPLKLFVFNSYLSYKDFLCNQLSAHKIESYYSTPCLTGNGSFPKTVNLTGNSYYFFGILYNKATIGINASAYTSQYSTEGSGENCTLSTNGIPCSFSASSFIDALGIGSDKQCLISQTNYAANENITVSLESNIGSINSGIAMMASVGIFIIVFVVVPIILSVYFLCWKKRKEFN